MRKLFVFTSLLWLLYLGACTPSKTCPAFQSYFILNEEARKEKFSKFDSDSLPKFAYGMKRTKFGIGKKVSYRKKQQDWNTIDMKVVMPNLEEEIDSILLAQETYDATDTILSEKQETPQSLRRRDRYNEDQLQYMQLFGKYLRKPVKNGQFDPSQELDQATDNGELGKPEKKKGLFGFLKKKDKTGVDEPTDPDNPDEEAPKKKKKKKKKKDKKNKDIDDELESGDDDISDTSF